MSKVEHLEKIIEAYGPHLHDAPYGGWRADRVIDKVVPTHCPYCAVQCGMNLLVENNHVVGFEPRYDFPVNEGRLCPKGVTAYLQIHHPDRLLHPLIKRNGMFERASWNEALDLVASKFKQLQAAHGGHDAPSPPPLSENPLALPSHQLRMNPGLRLQSGRNRPGSHT